MPGIGAEFAAFLHSFLAGVLVTGVYLSLRVLRRLVGHPLWAVNLEDAVYWAGTAVYLFVQIYHTSDGMIRWYHILGIAVGAIFMGIFPGILTKIAKKIYRFLAKKTEKRLAKRK